MVAKPSPSRNLAEEHQAVADGDLHQGAVLEQVVALHDRPGASGGLQVGVAVDNLIGGGPCEEVFIGQPARQGVAGVFQKRRAARVVGGLHLGGLEGLEAERVGLVEHDHAAARQGERRQAGRRRVGRADRVLADEQDFRPLGQRAQAGQRRERNAARRQKRGGRAGGIVHGQVGRLERPERRRHRAGVEDRDGLGVAEHLATAGLQHQGQRPLDPPPGGHGDGRHGDRLVELDVLAGRDLVRRPPTPRLAAIEAERAGKTNWLLGMRVIEHAVGARDGGAGFERPVPLPAEGGAGGVGGVLALGGALGLPEVDGAKTLPAHPLGHHPHGQADGASGRRLAAKNLLAAEVAVRAG